MILNLPLHDFNGSSRSATTNRNIKPRTTIMDNGNEARKRPRPVVSCLRCRDKKLRCDRSIPCTNCAKVNIASDCVYNSQGIQAARKQQRTISPENDNADISSFTSKSDGVSRVRRSFVHEIIEADWLSWKDIEVRN